MIKKKSKKAGIDISKCVACGCCMKVCYSHAIKIYKGIYAVVERDKCVGCGRCVYECPASVIGIMEVE